MRYILKDGKISGSMVCRDLRLEEKWECVSTLMIQDQQVSLEEKWECVSTLMIQDQQVSRTCRCCIQHMLLALKENE